jgi:hypothetical protein
MQQKKRLIIRAAMPHDRFVDLFVEDFAPVLLLSCLDAIFQLFQLEQDAVNMRVVYLAQSCGYGVEFYITNFLNLNLIVRLFFVYKLQFLLELQHLMEFALSN